MAFPAVARGSPAAPRDPQQTLQTTADLVKVDVSVADNHGVFTSRLTQSDFRVLDQGVEQTIVFFAPVEMPAQVLVMIETGPAVYLIRGEHLAAAYALLDGLDSADQVALVSYDEFPRQVLGFTTDRRRFLAALGEIQYSIGSGRLNFFDSLSKVLDWMKPLPGKQVLVVLTTGLDWSPPESWDALVEKIRRNNAVIFPVALGRELRTAPVARPHGPGGSSQRTSSPSPSASQGAAVGFAKADDALRSLATITGGRAYFPRSPQDFLSAYREIASALRHQYVLGFIPAHDGGYHALSVELVGRGPQTGKSAKANSTDRVFARQGYLAPGP